MVPHPNECSGDGVGLGKKFEGRVVQEFVERVRSFEFVDVDSVADNDRIITESTVGLGVESDSDLVIQIFLRHWTGGGRSLGLGLRCRRLLLEWCQWMKGNLNRSTYGTILRGSHNRSGVAGLKERNSKRAEWRWIQWDGTSE